MVQQVNLLGPAFRRQRDRLNLRTGCAVVVMAAALFGLAGVVLNWQADPAKQGDMSQQDPALVATQAKVAELKQHLEERHRTMDAEMRRVNEIEQAIARVGQVLRQGAPDASSGLHYAQYFQALANQAHSSLWITGFSVSADGRQLELRGQALDASALPDYLSRLNAEPVFKGRRFAQLSLGSSRPDAGGEEPTQLSDFVLRTGLAQDAAFAGHEEPR